MQTPTTKTESSAKPAIPADAKAKPAPVIAARDAQIASIFDSCIPGGMLSHAVQPPPAR